MGGNQRKPCIHNQMALHTPQVKARATSLIQACKYGNSLACASEMTASEAVGIFPDAIAASISAVSFAYTRGFDMMLSIVARMPVADVSEPATLCRESTAAVYERGDYEQIQLHHTFSLSLIPCQSMSQEAAQHILFVYYLPFFIKALLDLFSRDS